MTSRSDSATTVNVPYALPYDWDAMIAFFRARAIDGLEQIDGKVYRRAVLVDGEIAVVQVGQATGANSLHVSVDASPRTMVGAVSGFVSRIRRVFDTDSDMRRVRAHFSRDAALGAVVDARPGLRVPGGWDPFEIGVRAILGQQISVAAARRLAGRLVARCGTAVPARRRHRWGLSHVFPTPQQVADARLEMIGMPDARRSALKALARAAILDDTLFDRSSSSVEETVTRLRRVKGIGDWTAHYIALRASREPDAFPATDAGLIRGAARVLGSRPTPDDLLRRAESWRPWRAYAAQHLWTLDATAQAEAGAARNLQGKMEKG